MYGYVTPLKDQLHCSDFMMYRAFYCGICKATGKMYGQLPRFSTNYDIVFLSVLMHEATKEELVFETKGCVCNPFKKKVSLCQNQMLDKLVQTNIILSYYKLTDGVLDKEGFKKRVAKSLFSRPYKKARAQLPEIDEAVKRRYGELYALEQSGHKGIDRVSDCFAGLLQEIVNILLCGKASENILKLCYNVGKFVYLADALDDVGEDAKKKRYNPFLAVYPNYQNRKQYFDDNNDEFQFILASTINRAIECFNGLPEGRNSELLKNIVHKGLRAKAQEIFSSVKKLRKPKI